MALDNKHSPMQTMESPLVPAEIVSRTMLFERMYVEAFPSVARFVRKMNGSFQDAKDIFQDALVIYHEKLVAGQAKHVTTDDAYVLGIAKHLWLNKYKSHSHYVALDVFEKAITVPEDFYPTVHDQNLLSLLETAGQKCMDLLRGFYHERMSMKHIMHVFGFGSERSATVQKYKCIEKMRTTVQQKSLRYEDFWN